MIFPGFFVPDPMDVPAYATGMLGQWAISKDIIKRFPPGRFADMQTAVAVRLSNLQKKGEINPEVLMTDTDDVSRRLILVYKRILKEIKEELELRSMDVRDYAGQNKGLYKRVILFMTMGLARRWLLDQLYKFDLDQREHSLLVGEQIEKFLQYKEQSRRAALDYRNSFN